MTRNNTLTKSGWMSEVRNLLNGLNVTKFQMEQRYYAGDSVSEAVAYIRRAYFGPDERKKVT